MRTVPANSKKHTRIAALTEVVDRLSAGVDLAPRPLDAELERRFETAEKR